MSDFTDKRIEAIAKELKFADYTNLTVCHGGIDTLIALHLYDHDCERLAKIVVNGDPGTSKLADFETLIREMRDALNGIKISGLIDCYKHYEESVNNNISKADRILGGEE